MTLFSMLCLHVGAETVFYQNGREYHATCDQCQHSLWGQVDPDYLFKSECPCFECSSHSLWFGERPNWTPVVSEEH